MSCMRHSYPKGSQAGDGRTCRNCGLVDGASLETTNPDAATATAASAITSSTAINLPAHSPLGASGAYRWMECPGSVTLDELLRLDPDFKDDDPDYRRDGVQAHALGAHCLETDRDCWEADATQFPDLTGEMIDAVQVYLDYCRSLPSRITYIEHRMHRPEFHRLAFGTGDFISVHILDAVIDFVDYKHGVGVVVNVVGNVQLMYYGYLFIGEDTDEYPDATVMRFSIVQPRADAGHVRFWETTAGEIRTWARDVLLPAMNRVQTERYLSVGEWCRFCPAKLICPAMACLSDEVVHKFELAKELATDLKAEDPVKVLSDHALGDFYTKWQKLKMFGKAIEEETEKRVLNGVAIPGTKAVNKKAYMVWKDAAPIQKQFGIEGFSPKTPAQIRGLAGGKEFEAEWAFNANNGKFAVAPVTDAREPVEIASGADTFGVAVRQLAAE